MKVDKGVDEFPEEAKFQHYLAKYSFLTFARMQKLGRTMTTLAVKLTHEKTERLKVKSNLDKNPYKELFVEEMKEIRQDKGQKLNGEQIKKKASKALKKRL